MLLILRGLLVGFFVGLSLLSIFIFKIKKYVVIVVFILEFILICNFFIPIRQAIDKRILRSMDEIGNSM